MISPKGSESLLPNRYRGALVMLKPSMGIDVKDLSCKVSVRDFFTLESWD